ncbi:MAG: asparagine synthase C-terminal domain-containing protein [Candidatus Thorarchaeota archaeon]
MVGIICTFNPRGEQIEDISRYLNHRGTMRSTGKYSPKDMLSGLGQFTYSVYHNDGETAIVQQEDMLILKDSLHYIQSDTINQILSVLRKQAINPLDESLLKSVQGLVLLCVDRKELRLWRSLDGQKAIYYSKVPSGFLISTERKVLWAAGSKESKVLQPGNLLHIKWNGEINLKSLVTYSNERWVGSKEQALKGLSQYLLESIKGLRGKRCGVLFSGGVDSSLLAYLMKKQNVDVQLFSASYQKSRDRQHTIHASESLGLEATEIHMTSEMIWKALPDVIHAIETTNRMDVEIALPFYLAAKKATTMHLDFMVSGQGPDEQFAGYARYITLIETEGASALEKQLRADVSNTHEANISRDERAIAFAGLPVSFPYLDTRFTDLALSLPAEWKINPASDAKRKEIFRLLAANLGLESDLCLTPKKATQYSSGSSKGLLKAVGENVKTCMNMTKAEIEGAIQHILDWIGHSLGQPIELVSIDELGIDMEPTMHLLNRFDT